jgi:hypothetical protein
MDAIAERVEMCPPGFDAVTRQEIERPRSARFGVYVALLDDSGQRRAVPPCG